MRTAAIYATTFAVVFLTAPAMAFSKKDNADCGHIDSFDRSIAACTRLLKLGNVTTKNRSIFYSNRCFAWANKDDYDHAIADCTEAISLNPRNVFAYVGRGNALAKKTEVDRAMADFNEALRLNPKDWFAYNGRCFAWVAKGEYDRAIADCDEVLRLHPNDPNAYINRGNAWQLKGNFDRSIADYNEVIRLSPKNRYAYSSRGAVWGQKGDFDRAIADMNEDVRLSPEDPNSYRLRANVWRDMGDLDRAMADIDEAIRLEPIEQYKPYGQRGEIWRLKGDLDRALADQDEAIRLYHPVSSTVFSNAGSYVLRGDTLRYKGELSRALADYDEALHKSHDYIPALAGRGLTYEKMGDLARARVEFEKALASQSAFRAFEAKTALETARAHLAALDSGALQPVIPAAPSKATSATSIPTPEAVVPEVAPRAVVPQGRRVALVIGNSAYKSVVALPNPEHDAEKIAATLRAIGFESVTLANNLTHEKLVAALRAFADEVDKADWAMVYYAGHGMEVNGINYLIPVDAKLATDRDVEFEAVPLDKVMISVESAKKLKLILLDACRDNPFLPQMRHTSAPATEARSTAGGAIATRSIGRGLGGVKVSGATLVVYAAKGGQVALDGEGGNSPFAVAVVERLATPGVEINKIFRLVRDDVMEATAGRQEPYTYGSLPGREDFFFVTK